MSLNLRVLPLERLEDLVPQKCLMPQRIFPAKARPGHWAKCNIQSNQRNYWAVCQLFPREFSSKENACYLDNCVTSGSPGGGATEYDNAVLVGLVLLDEDVTPLKQADLVFSISPDFCTEYSKKLTKSYLMNVARNLLQGYRLTNDCTVRAPALLECGIDAVHVKTKEPNSMGCYIITDESHLHLGNVELSGRWRDTGVDFRNIPSFECARQHIDDLLKMASMQRNRNRLRLALNALVVGAIGCGKSSLVERCLREYKCNVFRITAAGVVRQYPGETEAELRKIFTAARHFEQYFKPASPTVILLEDLHLLCPQVKSSDIAISASGNALRVCAQLLSLVDDLFTSKVAITCLATSSAPEMLNEVVRRPGRFDREIVIVPPDAEERKQLFTALFNNDITGEVLTNDLIDLVARQTQGYVVADLALLVHNVSQGLITAPQRKLETVLNETLKSSKPLCVRGADVSVCKTTQGFKSIGGMEKLKRILEVSVLAGLKHQKAFQRFGLSLPKGVLLYGPPGCAKTTIAKCLAAEANMAFITTCGAEVYSPYVGCAEKFIVKLFDTARKNSPCLLFLDEIDSLVGRRTTDGGGGGGRSGDVQMRVLSTLLTEMDGIVSASLCGPSAEEGKHILVVAATNRPDMIDDALLRPGRFDKLIHVPAPDSVSRRCIISLHAQRMPFAKDLNLDAIAECTENYSGADICNLCNEAAMQAFQRDFNATEVLGQDFDKVLSITKSSLTPRQIKWYYEFENKFST